MNFPIFHTYSDYLHPKFTSLINPDLVERIFELGCNDGKDSILLSDFYSAEIFSFECNPDILSITRKVLRDEPNVKLIENAVWDDEAIIDFYPVTGCLDEGHAISNNGASSCFKARMDYRQTYIQKKVAVQAIRLDSFCRIQNIDSVDLMCIDLQGAALRALKGSKAILNTVKFVISEIEHRPIYHGQDLFPEINAFLNNCGFKRVADVPRDAWFSDYLYKREDLE